MTALPGYRLRGARALPPPAPRVDPVSALEAEKRALAAQLAERDARIAALEEQLTRPAPEATSKRKG